MMRLLQSFSRRRAKQVDDCELLLGGACGLDSCV